MDLFAAIQRNDRAGARRYVAEDFHAFENGVRMSGDELLGLLARLHDEGKRYQWSVTEPEVSVGGDLGVVAYVNVGSIAATPTAEPAPMSWLETAVLRRAQGMWRLTFLHSTRVAAPPPA
ncbi:MAG: nuclear transport factor 2 family protein [Proteobacteria bacterium]|nr:nuclear transport factor 2 family protein [Pseudomonadota bacterium]